MRKFILSAVAIALTASPLAIAAADAAPQQRTVTTVKERPNGRTVVTRRTTTARPQYRTWRKGQRFERRYAQNYTVVDYRRYRGRGVYAPPRGYHWVRSGNDAVLVGITSGLIGAVIGNAIR